MLEGSEDACLHKFCFWNVLVPKAAFSDWRPPRGGRQLVVADLYKALQRFKKKNQIRFFLLHVL